MPEVQIRKLTIDSIEQVRKWRNSSLINSVSVSADYITAEMQEKWFDKVSKDAHSCHWIIYVDDVKVGYAAVRSIDESLQSCEFSSLYIGEEKYLETGIGAVAEYLVLDYTFSNFTINSIACEVLDTNKSVIQLHKRFGFSYDGKRSVIKNDKLIEATKLVLIRNIWENRKAAIKKLLFK